MPNGVPIAVIDPAGITAPLFEEVLLWLQQQYRSIYGNDIDIAPDTQDGQWIAVTAAAIHEANQTVVSTYQAYSPTFAQGVGLSSVVKINGIRRLIATHSTALVRCIGTAGTDISNTVVTDNLNQNSRWNLPPDVIIPEAGEITVTVTNAVVGAIRAESHTITHILTPVPGWQSVDNPTPATPGDPVETDAELRRRQTFSVANPAQTVTEGIQGAIGNLIGVQRVMVYENPTSVTDTNGIPPYSLACVVQGGDIDQIVQAIGLRKTPGSPTFGTTQKIYLDSRGVPSLINYFELQLVPLTIEITLRAMLGYTAGIGNAIVAQVVQYVNELPIGYDSYLTKLIAATQLPEPDGLTYDVTTVLQGSTAAPDLVDLPILFSQAAWTDVDHVTLTVI